MSVEHLARNLGERGFSGSILLARDDRVVFRRAYGMADRIRQLPNAETTKYRVGSLTKQFTAAAVLLLHQRRVLELQDSLYHRINGCPDAWKPVTLHHLLTHTSGIRQPPAFDDQGARSTQLMTFGRDRSVAFSPGSQFQYNDANYILLAYVVEEATGSTYDQFLAANVFEPLNLTNTYVDHGHANGPDCAIGYLSTGEPAPAGDPAKSYGAGGLTSTVDDLLAWNKALCTEQLLSTKLIGRMFTLWGGQSAPEPLNKSGYSYGYGWAIGSTAAGRPMTFHRGSSPGFTSFVGRLTDPCSLAIVLSNVQQRFEMGGIPDLAINYLVDCNGTDLRNEPEGVEF